jgi:hypothetical protein
MNEQLSFSIQTIHTSGSGFKAIKPDARGIYKGVPVAIIGKPSRNRVLYDPASFKDSIVNPNTRFYKALVGGGLEGEWGHPITAGMTNQVAIQRMMEVDKTKVSHYFTRIFCKQSADGQYTVVYGDIVPDGPYGQYLAASFADTRRNSAFSLRSLTSEPIESRGVFLKKILALITFDGVSIPGFEEACKENALFGNESLMFSMVDEPAKRVSINDLVSAPGCGALIGQEDLTSQALLDLLEVDSVAIKTADIQLDVKYDKATNSLVHNGKRLSLLHTLCK